MGWAVAVFVAYAHGMSCLGVLTGPVHPALSTLDSEANAFLAECAALISAALLAASNYPSLDIAFVGDCQPALSCASGQCCTSGGVPQAAVRNSHLFRSSSSPGTLEYHHVKSHEGDFANEVVDVAARMAAHGLFLGEHKWPQLDSWLARGGACLSWASLVCRSLQGDVSLPDFAGGHLGDDADLAGLTAQDLVRPFLPAHGPSPESISVKGSLRFRITTVNVLTLSDPCRNRPAQSASGLAKRVARPALLAQCLCEAGIQVAPFLAPPVSLVWRTSLKIRPAHVSTKQLEALGYGCPALFLRSTGGTAGLIATSMGVS